MKGKQAGAVYSNDEIDVIGTLRLVWQKKWLVFFITLLTTTIGCLYIWTVKPVFEAKAYIFPPTQGDIAPLNYGRSNDKAALLRAFQITDVYNVFTNALLSQANRRVFFNEVYLPSLPVEQRNKMPLNTLYKNFNHILNFREELKYSPIRYTISFRSTNLAQATNWLERYIELVKQDAANNMMHIVYMQNKNMARDVEQRISVLREIAKERRQDRLNQLQEALNISDAVGVELATVKSPPIELASLNEPSLMYKRGSKALKAEIKNLRERQSDDAFTPELRDLEKQYNFWSKIVINPADVTVFRLDGNIDASDVPVAPRSRLIIAFSLILGLLLGLALVLIRAAFATNRAIELAKN